MPDLRIGTAGWAIPRAVAPSFGETGTVLVRYAGRFPAAEINSSFYRPHRPSTYAGWAGSVPDDFRFAAKLPKAITHGRRLMGADEDLQAFIAEVSHLGSRLGPLLIQLPPSLAFDPTVVRGFLRLLRSSFAGALVCEPRHPTWFAEEPDRLLNEFQVARVAADPVRPATRPEPGGWPGLLYFRLHGSPRIYYSAYDSAYLADLASRLARSDVETWCIFDNTAEGAACANALDLLTRMGSGRRLP